MNNHPIIHQVQNAIDTLFFLLEEMDYFQVARSNAVFDSMTKTLVGLNDFS